MEIDKIEQYLISISENLEIANRKLDNITSIPKVENPDKMLSAKETAAKLQVSVRSVYRRVNEGKLHSFKMGGNRVFAYSEVMRFLDEEKLKAKNNTNQF